MQATALPGVTIIALACPLAVEGFAAFAFVRRHVVIWAARSLGASARVPISTHLISPRLGFGVRIKPVMTNAQSSKPRCEAPIGALNLTESYACGVGFAKKKKPPVHFLS